MDGTVDEESITAVDHGKSAVVCNVTEIGSGAQELQPVSDAQCFNPDVKIQGGQHGEAITSEAVELEKLGEGECVSAANSEGESCSMKDPQPALTAIESEVSLPVAETEVSSHESLNKAMSRAEQGEALESRCSSADGCNKEVQSPPQGVVCNTSDWEFPSSAELTWHRSQYCGEAWLWKNRSCGTCGKLFMNLHDMLLHKAVHRGWRVFQCSRCSKTLASLSSLKKHRMYHCEGIRSIKAVRSARTGCWCNHCGKKFPNRQMSNVHSRPCTGVVSNMCAHCGKGFVLVKKLVSHQALHGQSKSSKYKCRVCDQIFPSFSMFKQHKISHSDPALVCAVTGKDGKASDTSRATPNKGQHWSRNTEGNTGIRKCPKNQCHSCGQRFYKKSNLHKHEALKHDMNYRCGWCGKGFQEVSHLETHKRVAHSSCPREEDGKSAATLQCKLCPETFSELKQLVLHQQVHVPNSVKILPCRHCGKVFSGLYSLQTHMVVHSGEKPFSCDLCGKAFAFRSCLRRHKGRCKFAKSRLNKINLGQTSKKPFICGQCGVGFEQYALLKQHIAIHPNDKSFACEFCDKQFATELHLKDHEAFHFGTRPEAADLPSSEEPKESKVKSCNQCGMSFSKLSHLKAHRVIHTGERPFACSFCNRKFAFRYSLKSHEAGHHTADKSQNLTAITHRCEPCGKYFASLSRLKAHSVVHTGEKPFRCKFCPKRFSFLSCVKRHETVHIGKKPNLKKPLTNHNSVALSIAIQDEPNALTLKESEKDINVFEKPKPELLRQDFTIITSIDGSKNVSIAYLQEECKQRVTILNSTVHDHNHSSAADCQDLSIVDTKTEEFNYVSPEDPPGQAELETGCASNMTLDKSSVGSEKDSTRSQPSEMKEENYSTDDLPGQAELESGCASNTTLDKSTPGSEKDSKRSQPSEMKEENYSTDDLQPDILSSSASVLDIGKRAGQVNTLLEDSQPEMSSKPTNAQDEVGVSSADSALAFESKQEVDAENRPEDGEPSKSVPGTEDGQSSTAAPGTEDVEFSTAPLAAPEKKHTCGVCGAQFVWASTLGTHLAHAHTDRTLVSYSCSVCGATFRYKKHVLTHMVSHSQRSLKCDFCDKSFRQTGPLRKHLLQSHASKVDKLPKLPLKTLKCYCGEQFRKRKNFLLHEKVHTNQRLYVCMTCHKVFLQPSSLHRHELSHGGSGSAQVSHKTVSAQGDPQAQSNTHPELQCKLCHLHYPNEEGLQAHMLLHEKYRQRYRQKYPRRRHMCLVCQRVFKFPKHLEEHMKSHEDTSPPYSCGTCGQTFYLQNSLASHKCCHKQANSQSDQNTDNKALPPHIDKIKSKGQAKLKQKSGLHTESPVKHVLSLLPPTSPIPDSKLGRKVAHKVARRSAKQANRKGMLSLWSATEVSDKHTCVVCHQVFKSIWALQNHLTVHLQLKPERCDRCGKIFAHSADLIQHKLNNCHADKNIKPKRSKKLKEKTKKAKEKAQIGEKPVEKEKPHVCDQCGSQFPARSHLKAHMVVHTGEKPYVCYVCDKRFSFASCLKRHSLLHGRRDDSALPKDKKLNTSTRAKSVRSISNDPSSVGVEYRCEDCGRVFTGLAKLQDHLLKHVGVFPYMCSQCGKQFINLNKLQRHQKNSHGDGDTRTHICEVCGKVYSQRRLLKAHLRVHSSSLSWICEACGTGFSTEQMLKKHQAEKQCGKDPNLMECYECHISFTSKLELKKHKQAVHYVSGTNDLELFTGVPSKLNLQNFKCEDCHKVFTRRRHLRKHRVSCKDAPSFLCATCGERFSEIKALENHIDQFHNVHSKIQAHIITSRKRHRRARGFNPSGKKHFRCGVCGRDFVTASQLLNHSFLHTGDMPVICESCGACFTHMNALQKHQTATSCNASGGVFKCKYCDKQFETLKELRHHNSSKEGLRFPCSKCSDMFKSCYRVHQHLKVCSTPQAPITHTCDVCGKNFANANNLKEHAVTHTGEKPFACGQCGRRFGHMAALRRHFGVHGGDLPFKCKVCDKGFTIASALKKHEASHLDVKSRQIYKCEECGKGFVSRQRLKRHTYLHADEKPLKCDFCGKGFINPFHLKNHLNQHHGIPLEEHPCKFCGQIFTSRFQLTQHQDLNCAQLAETISQLLPPGGPADPAALESLRDDEPVIVSPMVVHEVQPEEECVGTQTTEIIIQEDDGCGNITEKTIIVTLPENIDLAQWLQNGVDIQTTPDGETISYITALESPDLAPPAEEEEDVKDVDIKDIICQYCGEACISREELENHLSHQHPFVEFAELPVMYQEDPVAVPETVSMKQEPASEDITTLKPAAVAPDEEKNHMCQHCGKRFLRGHDLNRHVLKCSQSQIIELADQQLSANEKEEQQALEDKKRQAPKMMVKNYMCEECGAQYTRFSDFHCHQLNAHSGAAIPQDNPVKHDSKETNEDNIAEYTLNVANVLPSSVERDEETINSSKKTYACPLCEKVFSRKRTLQHHLLTHGDGKAFKCSVCEKSYAYESSLWSHMKIHEEGGKEKHSCFVCGKSYMDKYYLSKHMLTHTSGTMPYICSLCNKGFLLPAGLKRHRRDVHKLQI